MKIIPHDAKIQPRARIYIDKRDDNVFQSYEYMAWVTKGAELYRKEKGLPEHKAVGKDEEFTEFLKNVEL